LFPQLMMMQPDLLCNLVTQIHPQDLVKQGCRIVRPPFLPPSSMRYNSLSHFFRSVSSSVAANSS
jgi:hypothetical protein